MGPTRTPPRAASSEPHATLTPLCSMETNKGLLSPMLFKLTFDGGNSIHSIHMDMGEREEEKKKKGKSVS